MCDIVFSSVLNNEFINKNENTLYISEEQKRICKYKENTKSFIDIVPMTETILLNNNSSTNGRIEIPMKYNEQYNNKLIIQWGRADVVTGDNVINFNSPFLVVIWNLEATPNTNGMTVSVDKIDTSTFKINSSGNGRVFWKAVGI